MPTALKVSSKLLRRLAGVRGEFWSRGPEVRPAARLANRQLLVVPQRPAPLAQSREAAHQPPVGLLQVAIVSYGLPVGLRRLGVALSGGEEPSQEKQPLPVLPPELFLADHHSA